MVWVFHVLHLNSTSTYGCHRRGLSTYRATTRLHGHMGFSTGCDLATRGHRYPQIAVGSLGEFSTKLAYEDFFHEVNIAIFHRVS
jgi:hypothetical protein